MKKSSGSLLDPESKGLKPSHGGSVNPTPGIIEPRGGKYVLDNIRKPHLPI